MMEFIKWSLNFGLLFFSLIGLSQVHLHNSGDDFYVTSVVLSPEANVILVGDKGGVPRHLEPPKSRIPSLVLYDAENFQFEEISLNGIPDSVISFLGIKLIEGEGYLVPAKYVSTTGYEKVGLLFFDFSYEIKSWEILDYQSKYERIFSFRISNLVNEELLFGFSELQGFNGREHLFLLTQGGEIISQNSKDFGENQFITSICADSIRERIFISRFGLSERLEILDRGFSVNKEFDLPFDNVATQGDDAVTWYDAIGSIFYGGKWKIVLRNENTQTPPYVNTKRSAVIDVDTSGFTFVVAKTGFHERKNYPTDFILDKQDGSCINVGVDTYLPPSYWGDKNESYISIIDEDLSETNFSSLISDAYHVPKKVLQMQDGNFCVAGHYNVEGERLVPFVIWLNPDGTTSVANEELSKLTKLFPNPTHTRKINLSQELKGQVTQVIITDLTGRIITSQNWNGEELALPIGTPPGLFSVRGLKNGELVFMERLVVE